MKTKPQKKDLAFFERILLIANWIVFAFLLLSYSASFISPSFTSIPALFGLAWPFLFLANVVFVIVWIFLRRKLLLISLFAILAGWTYIGRHYQLSSFARKTVSVDSFRVLSFNAHNLTENNFKKLNKQQNLVFDFITRQSADVTCMQEFFSFGENYYFPLVFLKEALKADNYYFESYYNPYREKIVGMTVFSRLPRCGHGKLTHDSTRNFGIFGDYIFHYDTIRIYNIHLESLYLGQNDYAMITGSDIESMKNKKNLKQYSSRLIYKLIKAFEKRSLQVDILKDHIQNSPYPVVICGDFNDTPSSYAYHQISENLKDAFIESGSGLGKTFSGKLPFMRIDYILHDKSLNSYGYQAAEIDISDHFPVSCFISSNND